MTISRDRIEAAGQGAALGGLISLGIDTLGFASVLKLEVSILVFGIVVGAFLGIIAFRSLLWWGAGAVVIALAVISYTPLVGILSRPLIRTDPITTPKLDAIVVLAGGMTADSAMATESLDRLLKGLQLIREGRSDNLVVSRETLIRRGKVQTDRQDRLAVMSLVAISAAVYVVDSARDTHDEAVRVRQLPVSRGWKQIGLVTSPFHSRRACATFEGIGFRVTCIPSVSRDRAVTNLDSPVDRVRAFQGWIYETAGSTKYRLKGWIR